MRMPWSRREPPEPSIEFVGRVAWRAWEQIGAPAGYDPDTPETVKSAFDVGLLLGSVITYWTAHDPPLREEQLDQVIQGATLEIRRRYAREATHVPIRIQYDDA